MKRMSVLSGLMLAGVLAASLGAQQPAQIASMKSGAGARPPSRETARIRVGPLVSPFLRCTPFGSETDGSLHAGWQ